MESDFSFQGTPPRTQYNTKIGRWIVDGQKKGCVEYIYQPGDTVVEIGKGEHKEYSEAKNIMGRSGCALIIPMDYYVWSNYRTYKNPEDKNQRLYFSVLLRVKDNISSGKPLLYPYVEGSNQTSSITTNRNNIVYLAVDNKTGIVKKRLYRKNDDPNDKNFYTDPNYKEILYRNPEDNKYYTDKDYKELYEQISGASIRNYGWASCYPSTDGAPQMRWNPGFQYYYRLNYTSGVGVEDPADAFPGKPIIGPIEVSGSGHQVSDFEKSELQLEVQ